GYPFCTRSASSSSRLNTRTFPSPIRILRDISPPRSPRVLEALRTRSSFPSSSEPRPEGSGPCESGPCLGTKAIGRSARSLPVAVRKAEVDPFEDRDADSALDRLAVPDGVLRHEPMVAGRLPLFRPVRAVVPDAVVVVFLSLPHGQ